MLLHPALMARSCSGLTSTICGAVPQRADQRLLQQLQRRDLECAKGPASVAVIEAYRERASTLGELADSAAYLYQDPVVLDVAVARKHLTPALGGPLALLISRLSALTTWTRGELHEVLAGVAADSGIGFGKLGQPVRVAVTGGTVSPPLM